MTGERLGLTSWRPGECCGAQQITKHRADFAERYSVRVDELFVKVALVLGKWPARLGTAGTMKVINDSNIDKMTLLTMLSN